MMMNLFSTFDPSTSTNLSMNWLSTLLFMLMMPMMYWMIPNRKNMMITNMINMLLSEFKTLLNKKSFNLMILFISMFLFIMFNNLMGLLPYIFTSTSHMVFSLTLSMSLWISLMLFGWFNNMNNMFMHLIPTGTPMLLTPFMVCIETISNIIRPISLAVRLTANMIAGHLLMSLLGNNLINKNFIILFSLMTIQMMLMMFELAVAMIQAYVFTILSTLYSNEVIYEK
uniref:ATP synthase subunit a n=1 Tax=Stenopirates sp. HL-2011 TaxID=1085627 RepID=G3K2K9_9HEMI|nr:ATP synthase F0 subunit 6 [Stenopirates sp. HL-2011]AEK26846.1 ATP synthase F0 subunit 6 [Stenopirates sp. HL-2011]